ncbi:uncharacterized protein LOC141842717 [Curcuma longa]|uniref:uncharacterized protein LOC141842717 n=1 Tax=Curcuma longa TaxID=136217 RepID=UPI003D9DFD20
MERSEKLVWVVKSSFLIIGVASWLLIPLLHRYSFLDLLLLLHRYSFLIPFVLWLCKKEVVAPQAEVVVPQAAPAPPVASSVETFYDFLFLQTQEEEEEQQREYCDVDEPSAASQGAPAWWLSEPVLMVGKEAAAAEEFSWDGVVDSTVWMSADVAPSAPPIATAYSASFFDECCGSSLPSKAEGGWEDKSMEELWEAICVMKEEKRRRRRTVKEEEAGGGWRKREVPAMNKDELFQQADAFIKKQRHVFQLDLQREESPVPRPRRAVELDRRRQLPPP